MPHKHARTSIKMIQLRKSVSKIESAIKASMLDLKNSFSAHKVLLFWRQIWVCLPFENGSAIEKRIEVRYSITERWWGALFGFLLTYSLFGTQCQKRIFRELITYIKFLKRCPAITCSQERGGKISRETNAFTQTTTYQNRKGKGGTT